MYINKDRYWELLMELSEITDKNIPYTRRSFSDLFLEGRDWLSSKMSEAGLNVYIDDAGNLVGKKEGKDKSLKHITVGSHSDSVPGGGRFDGIAGVIAGLECALSWKDRGVKFNHPIKIIDFLAEEPCEWGYSCIGSRGISGTLSEDILNKKHPNTEETLKNAIKRMGGNPEKIKKVKDIAAFFELHIEQGQVLESEKKDIGLVTSIVGIARVEIELIGQSNHAGTTPMHLRRDSLTAASAIIYDVSKKAKEIASKGDNYLVATCGQVFVMPNASNVIPGNVKISFDIRSDSSSLVNEFVSILKKIATIHGKEHNIDKKFTHFADTTPAVCTDKLLEHLNNACDNQGASYKKMPSGAGHDAAFMSLVSPIAMVFVPSKDGKSHCAEEWTSKKELTLGVSIMAEAIESFDKEKD